MRLVPAKLGFHEGTPYSEMYGDVYHSADGGLAQARHVFLQGNGLPQRWHRRERFTVLETGFGFGLNFLATWQAWRADPQRCAKLHYVSIEKHPFALDDLRALHDRYDPLQEHAAQLHAAWPLLVQGGHRLELDGGRVVLTLFFADVAVLRELRLAADAVYLDGFSPARNPEMWTPALMRAVSRLCAPGATLATWSVASDVHAALERTGFAPEKRPGFGHKREMTAARLVGSPHQPSVRGIERKATVVGAGLAGAAVCERLCARGWQVRLIERHAEPAAEASGNHAGSFHPIVTPDDSVFARLTRSGFFHLLRSLERAKPRWDPCGVLQLARTEKEAASQQAAIAALGLPADYAQWVDREEATRRAGVTVAAGGLWFPRAGWVQPRSLVNALLDACGDRLERIFATALQTIADDELVILANSADAAKLATIPHVRMRRIRGQVSHIPADALEPPRVVLLRGGFLLPPVDGICVAGASFDIDDNDPLLRESSHAGNLERLAGILGAPLKGIAMHGRVGFRAVVPDRLPMAGRIADNIYAVLALGSRGLLWAPLAAEIVASALEGEPLPVEGKLSDALDPARFAKRALARRAGRQAAAP